MDITERKQAEEELEKAKTRSEILSRRLLEMGEAELERVMHFYSNKAVLCDYNQASSLGCHTKHEVRELITRAT